MYIKMIQLILFLLFIFEGVSGDTQYWREMCRPCICWGFSYPKSNGYEAEFPWLYKTSDKYEFAYVNPEKMRTIFTLDCRNQRNLYEAPSGAPANMEAVHFNATPFGRYGVKKGLLQKYTELVMIEFRNIEAQKIDVDVFQPQGGTLKAVLIDANPLVEVPVGIFHYAPFLENIYLHGNQIKKIVKGLFTNMNLLRWIRLERNQIEFIQVGAFSNIPALDFVNLADNRLTFAEVKIVDREQLLLKMNFQSNPWFCNEQLCPFMHYAKKDTKCEDPANLKDKPFSVAIMYVGLKVDRVRHTKELDQSVEMHCSSCDYTKLAWKKDGNTTLPPGVSIAYSGQNSTLTIDKVNEEHDGNYTCYNPDCTASDCNPPVVAVIVNIPEPVWNFTGREADVDEIVRYGDKGIVYGLLSLAIFSIVMAVCMSGYFIYVQLKKSRERSQQNQRQAQEDEEL